MKAHGARPIKMKKMDKTPKQNGENTAEKIADANVDEVGIPMLTDAAGANLKDTASSSVSVNTDVEGTNKVYL